MSGIPALNLRVVPPLRREECPPKPKKPKEPLRLVEHRIYGPGKLRCVRTLDTGQVADVTFLDGAKRTLRIAQEYWTTPIAEILAAAPPPRPALPVEGNALDSNENLGEHANEELAA